MAKKRATRRNSSDTDAMNGNRRNSDTCQKPILKHQDDNAAGKKKKKTTHAKFDETNILETFHPADKDYGHMKVDESPTPYHSKENSTLDSAEVARRLLEDDSSAKALQKTERDDKEEAEQATKRDEFEKKRKVHYNEFRKVATARKLMEEEKLERLQQKGSSYRGPSTSRKK